MEPNEEPNWTELLEKEYPDYRNLIEAERASGASDREIYQLLDVWG